MKRNCFKGCFCSKEGFTLIELLVVVLIIGILAAVAMPQYQVAVDKSRAMNYLRVLKSIRDAQEVYYWANGKYAEDFKLLDVELPGGASSVTSTQVIYKKREYYDMWVDGENGTQSIKAYLGTQLEPHFGLEYYLEHHTFWKEELPGAFVLCTGKTDRGKRACKALGGTYFATHANGTAEHYVISR